MSRLGANDDVRRLQVLLQDCMPAVEVGQADRIAVGGERVLVNLQALPPDCVERAIGRLLENLEGLWTRQVRVQLDPGDAMANALAAVNRWSRDSRWKVLRREGTPNIDLIREPREARDAAQNSETTAQRAQGLRLPRAAPDQSAPASFGAPANAQLDLRTDLVGLALGLALASPAFALCFFILRTAAQGLPRAPRNIAFVLVMLASLLLVTLIGYAVIQVVRPNAVHTCRSCQVINRIHPWKRTRELACGGCGAAIYGAWPIVPHTAHTCSRCHAAQDIQRSSVLSGRATCRNCDAPVVVDAKLRREAKAANTPRPSRPPTTPS